MSQDIQRKIQDGKNDFLKAKHSVINENESDNSDDDNIEEDMKAKVKAAMKIIETSEDEAEKINDLIKKVSK